MILYRLVLENFRQFYGRQEIEFAPVGDQNITLVHAENGFGKTTILKAILWALYGHRALQDDFEKPESILHEGLSHNTNDIHTKVSRVILAFQHDDKHYTLTRSLSLAQQMQNAKKSELTLEINRDGETFQAPDAQRVIQSIIPDGISSFLLFNGERINYLAEAKNSKEVTKAVHQMLGLHLLRRTIEDLNSSPVKGKLREDLKKESSEEKVALLDELQRREMDIERIREQQQQNSRNLEAVSNELDDVNQKLEINREAAELHGERRQLEREINEYKKKLEQVSEILRRMIAENGYTILLDEVVLRGREITQQLRQEGRIPARVLNTYLKELLDQGMCLCQRHLQPGTPEWEAVQRLFTYAGDQEFNNAVASLDHAIGQIESEAKTTKERVQQLKAERAELVYQIRQRESRCDEIHLKIGNKKDEEVKDLEAKRQQHIERKQSLFGNQKTIEERINNRQKTVQDILKQIASLQEKEEAAQRAQRRLDGLDESVDILQKILDAETQDLQPLLNNKIKEIFRKIMDREYAAELNEDFVLSVRKDVQGEDGTEAIDAALSTGQRTVVSLVFIASLVALARQRDEIPTILRGLGGSIFPVVIDSPFGSLSIFRDGIARYIPDLAPQVLLLVSPEQYYGQVESVFQETGRVGKRYYLAYHGPTMPDRAHPKLRVLGQEIPQYFQSDQIEYTQIKELQYDENSA